MIRQLMNLKAGKAVDCPVYDYTQHTRSDQVVRVEPKKVILLEGILVLADERLRDLLDIKVYVEADADERILRRIIRDVKERGRDMEGVVEQYLTTVKPIHLFICRADEMYGRYCDQQRKESGGIYTGKKHHTKNIG